LIKSTSKNAKGYVKIEVKPDFPNSLADTRKGRYVLERTAMKVARFVLRRGGWSNPFSLFDIVTGDSIEILLHAKEIISNFLSIRGLKLSDEKTCITHISQGFDLLGWNFRKYQGTLLAKPSKSSQENILQKIREIIHRGRAWSQDRLIANLNPIIRGWALYHKHAVSSDVFSRLDHIVWGMLYSWAKRRHSNKGKHWISHRYWHKIRNKSWTFASGKLILESFSNTKIERFRMAKLEMNPYIDRGYFEEWQERRRNFFPPTKQATITQFFC